MQLTYRISQGVLVSPFADTAVAVDLVTDTAHVLSTAGAWLATQDSPVDIAGLVAGAPADQRDSLVESVCATLDVLRTPALVDRGEPYVFPEPPVEAGCPTPGAHVGRTHAVIDGRIAFRSDNAELIHRIDTFLGDAVDDLPTRHFDIVADGTGGCVLHAADEWPFPNEERLIVHLPTVLNDDGAPTHGVEVAVPVILGT